MQSIMISIRPEWCERISSGEKTVEVRKTIPKIKLPFKCYIYETKNKYTAKDGKPYTGKGKVIGEFICTHIETYTPDLYEYGEYEIDDDELMATCLNRKDLWEYGTGKHLYGFHISSLLMYETPQSLAGYEINNAPQSWCYVYE